MSMRNYLAGSVLAIVGSAAACQADPPPDGGNYVDFQSPQAVSIVGYSGDAMEPFLSPDGQLLFFNSSNSPTVDTNLFYATRVDDLTFQYVGEVGGANTTSLDAVASMDRNGTFYFVSTRSYAQTASTIYSGHFDSGALSGVALVSGISKQQQGIVNFDAGISADGSTLYFVDGEFDGGAMPKDANLVVSARMGASFARLPSSADLLQNINTPALEYAPCISQSGLELFFTRFSGTATAIYRAARSSVTESFNPPQVVTAALGTMVEAPTLSPDEHALYYHQQVGGVFSIFRVTR